MPVYAFLCISVVSRGFLSITEGSSLLHPSLYYLSISLRRINRNKRPCVGDVSSAARVPSPGPLNARRERFRGKYEKSGKVQQYLCALRSYRVWTDRLEKVYCSWKSWNESAALRPLPFVCTNGPAFQEARLFVNSRVPVVLVDVFSKSNRRRDRYYCSTVIVANREFFLMTSMCSFQLFNGLIIANAGV